MLHFFQPAATLFVGLALFFYGLIQSLLHAPPASAFHAAAQAMPDAIAVLLFGLGITAIIVGVILLISGIRGVRSRTREISRAFGTRNHPHRRSRRDEYGEDWDDHPAYR